MHVQSNGGWLGGWLGGWCWPAGQLNPPPPPPAPGLAQLQSKGKEAKCKNARPNTIWWQHG